MLCMIYSIWLWISCNKSVQYGNAPVKLRGTGAESVVVMVG